MKTIITSRRALLTSLIFSPALSVASLVSLNAFDLCALVSTAAAVGLVVFALADYQRKPRFGLPSTRRSTASGGTTSHAAPADALVSWTHQTISV